MPITDYSNNLHENSQITELKIDTQGNVNSIAPQKIITDNLVFHPIFDVDFPRISELFITTSEDTLKYYSEPAYSNPESIREYVATRRSEWKNGDRFSYAIEYGNELIGKAYLEPIDSFSSYMWGIWLQSQYWGNGFSGERADAFIHVLFEWLHASVIRVGTHVNNTNSREAIEKYINRYGGSYYGHVPVPEVEWYGTSGDSESIIRHPEWAITAEDFASNTTGISTTIDGITYSQVEFN